MLLLIPFGAGDATHTIGAAINPISIEAQLATAVWTNLTADVVIADGLRWDYGIDGQGPTDCVASTGTMSFVLNNSPKNSGGVQGWYSPVHASKRTGWTFGIPIRLVLTSGSGASVTSITRSGSTATVTTGAAHGLSTGHRVQIVGATEVEYNGIFAVNVTGATTFTYSVAGTVATPATGTILWTQAYIKFRGKVREIKPVAGENRTQKVSVVAHDLMRDLLESDARQVTLQIDQRENGLILSVLSALPEDARPVGTEINTGVDVYPFAFDNVGGGVKAGALIKDVTQSAFGLSFIRGDGTFVYLNRHTRGTGSSVATFNNTMSELEVPSSLDGVYNHARVTIHPKTIDATPTTVLYALTGSPLSIGAGATVTIWGDYRDPTDVTRLVGGVEAVVPLVAGTDYSANTEQDGTGLDKTSMLTITATPFASTAKFQIVNTDQVPVFLRVLQIRGKGVYDDGPQTFEAFTEQSYGDRAIDVDMPYQDNHFIGQSAATYIDSQYRTLETQIASMTIPASANNTLFQQALLREPGDIITATETMTGVSGIDAVIHRVEFEAVPGGFLTCRWGLAPAAPHRQWWQLGLAGRSELGTTTRLGF